MPPKLVRFLVVRDRRLLLQGRLAPPTPENVNETTTTFITMASKDLHMLPYHKHLVLQKELVQIHQEALSLHLKLLLAVEPKNRLPLSATTTLSLLYPLYLLRRRKTRISRKEYGGGCILTLEYSIPSSRRAKRVKREKKSGINIILITLRGAVLLIDTLVTSILLSVL
jgi:hypothetical protein